MPFSNPFISTTIPTQITSRLVPLSCYLTWCLAKAEYIHYLPVLWSSIKCHSQNNLLIVASHGQQLLISRCQKTLSRHLDDLKLVKLKFKLELKPKLIYKKTPYSPKTHFPIFCVEPRLEGISSLTVNQHLNHNVICVMPRSN